MAGLLEALGALRDSTEDLMTVVIPFALGVLFMGLACLQHTHSVKGLWLRSMGTSSCLGTIQFVLVRWAAKGATEFWIFQAGSCVGAGLGSYLSSRLGNIRLRDSGMIKQQLPAWGQNPNRERELH